MRDTDLYRHLLGLVAPWSVGRVELNVAAQRVDVCWVEHPRGYKWSCPECGQEGPLHDHGEERIFLHSRPPRVNCSQHGVRQVKLPWAEPHSRFTLLFERFTIDVLQQTNTQAARDILGIGWDEAWHLPGTRWSGRLPGAWPAGRPRLSRCWEWMKNRPARGRKTMSPSSVI